VAEIAAIKYRAFLSYSHRDKAWAKWLHSALESYHVDKDLVGRDTPAGPVPETLRPIFRDRDDFSAGHSLTEQTIAALESSQFLIVICSPNASRSAYVNEEIRRFKTLGRADRIIPVIVAGEPDDPDRDCFPPALRFKLGAEGQISDEREEPIAADARPEGDGKEMAKQKVVAGLLGLGLDEILRRGERARKRRARARNSIIALLVVLTIASAGGLTWARHELARNEALLDRTLERATGLVNKTVKISTQFRLPVSVSLSFLEEAEQIFNDIADLGSDAPKVMSRKVLMLIQFGRNYAILGQSSEQRVRVAEAYRIAVKLAKEHPDDQAYQYLAAASAFEVGRVEFVQGRIDAALDSLRTAEKTLEPLVAANPGNFEAKSDLADMQSAIGGALKARGDHVGAAAAYKKSQDLFGQLVSADPENTRWRGATASVQVGLGDVFLMQLDLDNALGAYRASLPVLEHLAAGDPKNLDWQNRNAVVQSRIGGILRSQGKPTQALAAYKANLAITQGLAAADPKNSIWQHNLSIAHQAVGDLLADQSRFDEAIAAYQESLAIRQRLASADRLNVLWLVNLSTLQIRIGDVHRLRGRSADALAAFEIASAISDRLVASDPNMVDYQISRAWCHEKIADTLADQGRLADALLAYKAALGAGEKLATDHPTNVVYQTAVSSSHLKIGNALLDQGDFGGALAAYGRAVEIADRLPTNETRDSSLRQTSSAAMPEGTIGIQDYLRLTSTAYETALKLAKTLSPSDLRYANWLNDLAITFVKNGEMLAARGYLDNALSVYVTTAAIRDRLAAADPANLSWQRNVGVAHERIGNVLKALNRNNEALEAHNRSFELADLRLTSDPTNLLWQRDRSVALEKIGDVLVALSKLDDALAAYKTSLEVRERLGATHETNADKQRDLFISLERIGDVLRAQGQYGAGLDTYKKAFAIADRMAGVDRSNREWRRNISRSRVNIGDMSLLLGNLAEGEVEYQRVLANCHDVSKQSSPDVGDVIPCAFSLWRLGTLQGPSGRSELQLAYNLLKQFKDAGLLDSVQMTAFLQIERQLNQPNAVSQPPGLNWPQHGPQPMR
jgi:tetratricopeptide (TPR) repeat protein